ncbi:hypothetical protein ACIBL3_39175 [Kribbella sp. NPDC050124]|uniref:hypothetical protein n=1 Tax=Kribbella sp. NPDC050124 TaxID=3364114 RepID=UPI0037A9AE53
MRATYEDLLRVARRDAVVAYNLAESDDTDLLAGWQATLTAARHHFRWLRLELSTKDLISTETVAAEGPLAALARSVGAGGDLLASQNGSTCSALDNERSLAAARSELAAITGLAARAALTRLIDGQLNGEETSDRLFRHLVEVTAELEFLRVRGTADLGTLRGLATTLPRTDADHPSRVVLLAARWQSAHEATTPGGTLTRDLRSTTAQLRTAVGYALHLADLLSQSAAATHELRQLVEALRTADVAAARVARGWRTRLSDLNGSSEGPAEATFVELLGVLRTWLRDGEHLRQSQDLIVDGRTAAVVRDVIDELVHSAARVAKVQQETLTWLVTQGHLFVPRVDLAKRDPEFDLRPDLWRLRYPQPAWVRTNQSSCFDQVTADLAEVAHSLSAAAQVARRIAGTTDLRRPFGPERVTAPPVAKRSPWRWSQQASTDLIPQIYRDSGGLER